MSGGKQKRSERIREFARELALSHVQLSGAETRELFRRICSSPGVSDRSVYSMMSRIKKTPEFIETFEEYRARVFSPLAGREGLARGEAFGRPLAKEERMALLSSMAIEAQRSGSVKDAVLCIQELNKMDGAYAPEQSESRLDVRQVIASLDFKTLVSGKTE